MNKLDNLRPLITDARTSRLYNRAYQNTDRAFTAVDNAAKRLGIEIQLNQQTSTEETYNTQGLNRDDTGRNARRQAVDLADHVTTVINNTTTSDTIRERILTLTQSQDRN